MTKSKPLSSESKDVKASAKPSSESPSAEAPAKSAAPKRPAPPRKKSPKAAGAGKPPVSAEQRRHYIEVAAYYIAERRGFAGADPHDDWVQAEIEIDRLLAEGKLNS